MSDVVWTTSYVDADGNITSKGNKAKLLGCLNSASSAFTTYATHDNQWVLYMQYFATETFFHRMPTVHKADLHKYDVWKRLHGIRKNDQFYRNMLTLCCWCQDPVSNQWGSQWGIATRWLSGQCNLAEVTLRDRKDNRGLIKGGMVCECHSAGGAILSTLDSWFHFCCLK